MVKTHFNSQSSFLIICLLFIVSGCAVLTKSQVQAVNEFASATQGFSTYPESVLTSYIEIREEGKIFKLATDTYTESNDIERAWDDITEAHQYSKELRNQSKQLHDAIKILDTYAELLKCLSSDSFTEELEKSAVQFGNALDDGVKKYNENFQKEIKPIGSYPAIVFRAIGGIYIRYQQAKLLKYYIQSADEIIINITKDVEALLNEFVIESGGVKGNLQAEFDKLRGLFIVEGMQEVENNSQQLRWETVNRISEMIKKIEETKELAEACIKSASNYRAAHNKLNQTLSQKRTIERSLPEIQTLISELSAAMKLKKSLE